MTVRKPAGKGRTLLMAVCACFLVMLAAARPAAAADFYSFRGDSGEKFFTNIPGDDRTPAPARFPMGTGKGRASAVKAVRGRTALDSQDYGPVIEEAAGRFSLDPDLVRAVIKVESNFNRHAVSRKGASGLMQLMPGTARELGVSDPFDAEANIHGGTGYLSSLLDATGGDLRLGLAAYNAGLQRIIEAKGMPAIGETRDYVRRVLDCYGKLKGL